MQGQIEATHALAVTGGTPQGYFLGSCFFQHTLVDSSRYQGFDTTAVFSTHTGPAGAYRVDVLAPLPVWQSVRAGYAPPALGAESSPVRVTFRNYCAGQTVEVYLSAADGSSCTKVDTSAAVVPVAGQPNSYSASIDGAPDCASQEHAGGVFTPRREQRRVCSRHLDQRLPGRPGPRRSSTSRYASWRCSRPRAGLRIPEVERRQRCRGLRGSPRGLRGRDLPDGVPDADLRPAVHRPRYRVERVRGRMVPGANTTPVATCGVRPSSRARLAPTSASRTRSKSAFPCSENPGAPCAAYAPFGGTPPGSSAS